VYAVSIDEDAHLVREYLRQTPLDFPVLLDPGGKIVAARFGVQAHPSTFFISRAARIGEIWVGERDWDAVEVRATIDRLVSN
jgi:peroxiredoxin